MNRCARVLLLAAATARLLPPSAEAQSGLEQVERLTRLGRTEEARDVLLTWWEEDRGDADRRELQRALWLRGRLTVDPVQAGLDFRRLVVLYPSGPFTPDALFRLAQASFAMGDDEQARGYVETLARDYPRSDARRAAEAWLADAGPVPPPGDTPTRAVAEPDPDRGGGAPPPVERPERERTETRAEPSAAGAVNYYVQLGAFAEEERAIALGDEARAQGVDARVVRADGSRFTHVRVGRFAEREEGGDLLDELTAPGLNAALVRDDRPERPIGR